MLAQVLVVVVVVEIIVAIPSESPLLVVGREGGGVVEHALLRDVVFGRRVAMGVGVVVGRVGEPRVFRVVSRAVGLAVIVAVGVAGVADVGVERALVEARVPTLALGLRGCGVARLRGPERRAGALLRQSGGRRGGALLRPGDGRHATLHVSLQKEIIKREKKRVC